MLEGIARPLAIADIVTPFEAQRAVAAQGAADMTARVPLFEAWTDDALRAIDEATAAGTAQRIRDALQDKVPGNETELVRAMAAAKLEPAQWSAVLGAVICSPEPVETARVDFARASEAVLRSLPGISAEKAAQLVQERESLDAAERTQLAWPVAKGVLTADEFALLAPHLSMHGWLWRVRLVSGTIDPVSESDTLVGVQVWDVVVDLSENPPRFASLRDSTLLPVAVALAAQMARERTPEQPEFQDAPPDEPTAQSPQPATEPAPLGKDEPAPAKEKWDRMGDKLRDERTERQRAERERRAARAIGGAPRGGTPASSPSAPRSDDESASDDSTSGRTASDAPAAHTPAGGLSGRWRTRGSR
jgi:DNA uptake protein ComE-like DNA-binding protein